MKNTPIESELGSKDDRSFIEKLLSWASELPPNTGGSYFESNLLSLDKRLQDFDNIFINEVVLDILSKSWNQCKLNRFDVTTFAEIIRIIDYIFQDSQGIAYRIKLLYDKLNPAIISESMVEVILKLHNVFREYKNISPPLIPPNSVKVEHAPLNRIIGWRVTVMFKKKQLRVPEVAQLLWHLSEIFESVPGVTVTLKDWGRGSFWASLFVLCESNESFRELKGVLFNICNTIVTNNIDKKSIAERNQMEAVTRKTEAESNFIECKTMSEESPDEAKQRRSLDMQMKAIEIRKALIEVKERELAYLKNASYVLKEGLVMAENLSIEVDRELLIKIEDGKISSGPFLDKLKSEHQDQDPKL